MSKPPVKPNKSFSADKIRQSSDLDSPEIEHVEMVAGPRTGILPNPNTPVSMTDKSQLYSSTAPLPSRTLANARAALQQLVLKPRYASSYIPLSESDSQSPIKLPAQLPPAMVPGQSGIQNHRRSSCQSACSSPEFIARYAQTGTLPAISFGSDAPTPRWRIQRAHPLLAPPALQWIFDAGTGFTKYGWSDDTIYVYAYMWLEDALGNPSFGRDMRSNFLDGPDATAVTNNEDPLPVLPLAPNTSFFQSWYGSRVTNDRCGYMRTAYERSRQARPQAYSPLANQQFAGNDVAYNNRVNSPKSSLGVNEADYDPELNWYRSTHTLQKGSTGGGQPMPPGGYKWIWFIVAFLILSMFLCLFLYAFRIIK
ncbi:hypothetical protein BBP40_007868 [Aspergillus hancockii]|nr:hypothetical protein BBP40_007868 [Aspergillus hancockii]